MLRDSLSVYGLNDVIGKSAPGLAALVPTVEAFRLRREAVKRPLLYMRFVELKRVVLPRPSNRLNRLFGFDPLRFRQTRKGRGVDFKRLQSDARLRVSAAETHRTVHTYPRYDHLEGARSQSSRPLPEGQKQA